MPPSFSNDPPRLADAGNTGEKALVWVVDDSPTYARRAEELLAPRYAVEVFYDGPAMLERLANGASPDVLVLDWILPGMSGAEVLRFLRLRHDEVTLPVLVLTVQGQKTDILEGLEAGANDYVTKPYDAAEMLARVRTLVRVRQLHEKSRRAERALQESEARFRSVIEPLPVGLVIHDQRGVIQSANPSAARILGLSVEQMAGRTSLDPRWQTVREDGSPLPGESHPAMLTLATGAPQSNVVMGVRRPDGALVWLNVDSYPLAEPNTRAPLGVVTSFADVTHERATVAERDALAVREQAAQAEAQSLVADLRLALRSRDETLALFDTLLATAPIGLSFCDRNLRYVRINEALAEINGVPVEQTLGRTLSEVIPRLAPRIEAHYRRVLATGEPVLNQELSGETPREPGRIRHWLVSYYPVRGPEGSPLWVGTIVLDVTEQQRVERALDVLARSGAALSSSLDTATTLDNVAHLLVPSLADWCVVYLREEDGTVRQGAVVHVDPSTEDLMRETFAQSPLPPDATHGYPRVLRTGESELIPEMSDDIVQSTARDADHLRRLRELKSVGSIAVPLAVQGRILGVLAVGSSVSGRRYDQADLALVEELGRRAAVAIDNARLFAVARRERQRAEEANRAKDEFLAAVSHELRTPLTAILGWLRMLRTGAVSPDKRERALETVERNARVQIQLVEDLLDISRIITGKLRLTIGQVDPAHVVEMAIEAIRPAAAAKGVRILPLLDSDAGMIMGDPDRLQQIVWNLLSNAVKFTPKGGRVHVQLSRHDSSVELAVSDTGKGIARAFLPYVFERFRQQDAGIARQHGGLGLGLAIVRHLVELHGGTIEADSAGEGRGATFTVRIPIAPLRGASREPAAARGPEAPHPTGLRCPPEVDGLRVLVVDDEDDARELVRSVLESCGARVTTAANAMEAFDRLRDDPPDVLVSDIGMPGKDGYSLIREIRALPPERGGRVPATALTAYARMEDRMQALEAGFNHHVAKPIEPEVLLMVIGTLAKYMKR